MTSPEIFECEDDDGEVYQRAVIWKQIYIVSTADDHDHVIMAARVGIYLDPALRPTLVGKVP